MRGHQRIDVGFAGPGREQVPLGVEVDRRHHRDQVRDALGVQRRVAQAQRAALTDAEQVDLVDTVFPADVLDAVIEIPVHVVVDLEPAVRTIGIAPVDQVDVETGAEQAADQRRSSCRSIIQGRVTGW